MVLISLCIKYKNMCMRIIIRCVKHRQAYVYSISENYWPVLCTFLLHFLIRIATIIFFKYNLLIIAVCCILFDNNAENYLEVSFNMGEKIISRKEVAQHTSARLHTTNFYFNWHITRFLLTHGRVPENTHLRWQGISGLSACRMAFYP